MEPGDIVVDDTPLVPTKRRRLTSDAPDEKDACCELQPTDEVEKLKFLLVTPTLPPLAAEYVDEPRLWLPVFAKLDVDSRMRAAGVCKAWRDLLAPADVWADQTTLRVGLERASRSKRFGDCETRRLRVLLPRCGAFVRLAVFYTSVHTEQLTLVADACTALTALEFHVGLFSEQLHTIGVRFGARLVQLYLAKVFSDQDLVLEWALMRSRDLRELRFGAACELRGTAFQALPLLPRLQIVGVPAMPRQRNLPPAAQIGQTSIRILEHLVPAIRRAALQAQRRPSLASAWQAIDLSGVDLSVNDGFALLALGHVAQQLIVLCLSGSRFLPDGDAPAQTAVSDNGFWSFLESFHRLRYLDLSFVERLADFALEALRECRHLRVLSLEGARGFTCEGVRALAHCDRLEALNLSSALAATVGADDEPIGAAASVVEPLAIVDLVERLRSLRILAVERAGLAGECVAPMLLQKRPTLVVLAVVACSEAGLKQIETMRYERPVRAAADYRLAEFAGVEVDDSGDDEMDEDELDEEEEEERLAMEEELAEAARLEDEMAEPRRLFVRDGDEGEMAKFNNRMEARSVLRPSWRALKGFEWAGVVDSWFEYARKRLNVGAPAAHSVGTP